MLHSCFDKCAERKQAAHEDSALCACAALTALQRLVHASVMFELHLHFTAARVVAGLPIRLAQHPRRDRRRDARRAGAHEAQDAACDCFSTGPVLQVRSASARDVHTPAHGTASVGCATPHTPGCTPGHAPWWDHARVSSAPAAASARGVQDARLGPVASSGRERARSCSGWQGRCALPHLELRCCRLRGNHQLHRALRLAACRRARRWLRARRRRALVERHAPRAPL
jgi:hypothetical protein